MPEEVKETKKTKTELGTRLDNLLQDVDVLVEKYGYDEEFILVVLSMLMNYDNQVPVEYTQTQS